MSTFGPQMPAFSQLAPDVRRIVAPNPSMMTGPGTNTYLFGINEVAVLDPGPVIDSHLQNIVETAGAPLRWILVTHTHPDHSPGAAVLAEMTGAQLLGIAAPDEYHQDQTFKPDKTLADGDKLTVDGRVLEAIHTPGHASNHVCYKHAKLDWVFTGDHVIDGSTVVINPPDGNMKHYIESLQKLNAMQCAALAPGHGEIINEPERVISWIIDHRLEREEKVQLALRANPFLTPLELVPHVYKDVDKKLYGWAERSLLAHLIKLQDDGVAFVADGRWTAA